MEVTGAGDPRSVTQRLRIWLLVCLTGLGLTVLLTAAVLTLKQNALREEEVRSYTLLAGDAEWEGDWELSEKGADPSETGSVAGTDRVTIPFAGNQLALQVRRGSYRAYLWVSVDGQPANELPRTERGAYLVLSSPDYESQVATIPVASGLADGPHVAQIVADRGWDQWPLIGWVVKQGPDPSRYDHTLKTVTAIGVVFLAGLIGWGAQWAKQANDQGEQATSYATPSGIHGRQAWIDSILSPILIAIAAAVFYVSPWTPLTILSGVALGVGIMLRLDLGLALVAFSAPFYLHPRPLFGKSFSMVEIATLLALASWGVRQARRGLAGSFTSSLRALSLADFAVLCFIPIAAVSALFADYRHVALRELRVVVIEPALLYLMLRTSRLDEKSVWHVAGAFIVGAVIVALIGISQYALDLNVITAEQGFRRLRSVYGSPNNTALYLGRALPILIAVAFFAEERRRRTAYAILTIPVGLALLLTFSRAAILLGIPASLLALGTSGRGRWRWVTLGLVAVAALGLILLLSTPRFAGLLDPTTGTLFFRLQLWRSSWKMFLDHPWLGVGPDNFLYQYRGRYILPSAWAEPHLSHAHNIALSYATRLGLLGLGVGILLQISFWRRAVVILNRTVSRDYRALSIGFTGSMAYAMGHGLVDASYFFVDLAFAFLLTLGLVQCQLREETYGQED